MNRVSKNRAGQDKWSYHSSPFPSFRPVMNSYAASCFPDSLKEMQPVTTLMPAQPDSSLLSKRLPRCAMLESTDKPRALNFNLL